MANEKSGTSVRDNILAIEQNIAKVMVGCEDVTRLIMTALITGGHVRRERAKQHWRGRSRDHWTSAIRGSSSRRTCCRRT